MTRRGLFRHAEWALPTQTEPLIQQDMSPPYKRLQINEEETLMKTTFFRFSALVLILSLLLSVGAAAANADDYDIPNDWSHDALVFAVENDILRGDEHQKLNPQKNITRAEMAAVLVRLLGASDRSDLSAFPDVDPDAWYYDELSAAYAAGIFGGSDGKMLPNSPITREQAVVVLCRAFGSVSYNRTAYTAFSDGKTVSAYARDSVSALRELGLLSGYEDGTLRPQSHITRAEIAQLLYNILDCIADTPDELPASGTVLYRGTQPLPNELKLNGTLILAQSAPAVLAPTDWEIRDALVLRTGTDTNADLTNVTTRELVCAPLGGKVSGAADKVFLWGVASSYTGSAKQLTVLGGSHTFTGSSENLTVRAGTLTHQGDSKTVALDENTRLVLNGGAESVVIDGSGVRLTVSGRVDAVTVNGKNAVLDGSGSVGTLTIQAENCSAKLPCDTVDDVWYETYQKEHDAALKTVQTMRVACTVQRATAIYKNQNFTGYLRDLPVGTTVYNEWHPSGDAFYVSLEDGTKGWVPRWDCYIPDDTVTTDGTLDYSKATKEGFVDLRGYDSKTDYLVWISRYTQKVIVFQGKKGDWEVIRTFPCSSGANNTPTPEGIYTINSRTWRWNFDYYYVDNVSIFSGGHAFHSILIDYGGNVFDGRVGIPLSHGCVRMLPDDCRYIYSLPMETRVIVY